MTSSGIVRASLHDMKIDEVLSEDPANKSVALLGSFTSKEGQAVVLLAKKHFEVEKLPAALSATELDQQFANDVYSKFTGRGSVETGAINVDIIWPATKKHIDKYSRQEYVMVSETPEMYERVVQPYIKDIPASRLHWVYNILEKKAESERIIYEDVSDSRGFLLLPDMKWDQSQIESLYLQAIAKRRDISSLRDLREEHLPFLRNIHDSCKKEVSHRFGLEQGQIRMWVHYQPSYYHFHVHIAHTKWAGASLSAGKAILLEDVIDGIQTFGDSYFQKRTLTYSLGKNEELFKLL